MDYPETLEVRASAVLQAWWPRRVHPTALATTASSLPFSALRKFCPHSGPWESSPFPKGITTHFLKPDGAPPPARVVVAQGLCLPHPVTLTVTGRPASSPQRALPARMAASAFRVSKLGFHL